MFTIETINNEHTFYHNGEEIATVTMDNDNYLGCVNIEIPHRGKGYYKHILKAMLTDLGYEYLISVNRNEKNQFAYAKWLGEEVENDQEVSIELQNGELKFEIID